MLPKNHEKIKSMWEYTTKTIEISFTSISSLDDKLNELGKEGWEAFSISSEKYYDPRLRIGKYRIQSGIVYTVHLKRHINVL